MIVVGYFDKLVVFLQDSNKKDHSTLKEIAAEKVKNAGIPVPNNEAKN